MKIVFTKDGYETKKQATEGLKTATWLEVNGNYEDVLALYNNGNTIALSRK